MCSGVGSDKNTSIALASDDATGAGASAAGGALGTWLTGPPRSRGQRNASGSSGTILTNHPGGGGQGGSGKPVYRK